MLTLALGLYGSERLATAYLEWMAIRADDLMARNWRLVRAVANKLLHAGSLDSMEILAAIQAVLELTGVEFIEDGAKLRKGKP